MKGKKLLLGFTDVSSNTFIEMFKSGQTTKAVAYKISTLFCSNIIFGGFHVKICERVICSF